MQGFKAIDVKFCENSLASHCLYLKSHNVREKIPEKPPNKTLFIVGIPPYCNEECIKELFSLFGSVRAVYFHQTPCTQVPVKEEYKYFTKEDPIKGFKVAYVVFEKESYLKKALDCSQTLVLPNKIILTGIQKWNKEYNESFPDKEELEEEIKLFMNKFDSEMSKKDAEEKALSQPQDGWMTVTRKGKKPGFARKESVAKHLMNKSERQRRKKELTNFYTFQIKESKMKNIVALRKKFEEDKMKISAMKEARRFKPF